MSPATLSTGPAARSPAIALALLVALAGAGRGQAGPIEEIVVTTERRATAAHDVPASLGIVTAEDIAAIGAQHPHELLARVPGVWLSRGSGQESLAAIRSPVLTGAGACGAFLTLEDGIPSRPPGFCNVNQLFELNTEQADAIEVLRGPGSVLYGANALHGLINVRMPAPGSAGYGVIEAGANDFLRLQAALPFRRDAAAYGSLLHASDGGFRADTGYRQSKVFATASIGSAPGDLRIAFTATDLSQDTGGFIVGEDAYRDEELRVSNPNPEAFRDASSQRAYGIWTFASGAWEFDLRPYVRHSSMSFLQHFLPGQPLEENSQASAGLLALAQRDSGTFRLSIGADADLSRMRVEETQDGPAQGSDFIVATRPAGAHYDYEVDGFDVAAYAEGRWQVTPRVELGLGLRGELTYYDYDNRMLDGNTRDDGQPCDFGGCLYTRPADRSDRYANVAPHLSLQYAFSAVADGYLRVSRGFRPPQTTELYRLQSGQSVADLDSESLDAAEAGLHLRLENWLLDAAVFAMRKRDSVLRDADGYTVSGGRTRHAGIELDIDGEITPSLRLALAASYARHTYDFDRDAAQGETFVAGRDVDTAPRWLGSADLTYAPSARAAFGVQWTTIGQYFVDAGNLHDYPGHALWNARAVFAPTAAWQFTLRLNNVTDERYADRADYAFGNYRYFPGRARELFVEIRYFADPG